MSAESRINEMFENKGFTSVPGDIITVLDQGCISDCIYCELAAANGSAFRFAIPNARRNQRKGR